MKKKYIKIIIMLVLVISITGCTKNFKNEGKLYTENILCKPEKQETLNIYKEGKIDISNLPTCSEFNISSSGYEGLWTTIFVKPLAFLLLKVGQLLNSYGLSIIAVTILLRLVVIPVTAKTAAQSENMKKAQPEIDKLNKKYENKNDRDSLMLKSQEQLLIYKKYEIKPLSGCLFALIQIPIFFAFFEAINRIPVLFEENFLNLFELRRTPMEAFKLNQYYYVIFIILIIGTTYFSFKMNKTIYSSPEQEKQMKLTTNIMVVMISILSFNLTTGIGLYWIFNSGFTIVQNLIVKGSRKNVTNS
ncbi:MAG: YidC/Oxa1 family membrane protein insertase [Bacilli bacterium]|nr:YidC/Oxa1 family membrane protein insertase [Bacilli bacterium]MDD4282378.1 YidC/Oxa1 family membrane protein insertase [Bacilli bacterium]MDD4718247.1 YidC/Oxa1 family membrane protein insertase [Bacilli bacterium]